MLHTNKYIKKHYLGPEALEGSRPSDPARKLESTNNISVVCISNKYNISIV
jgi:hypothetical protein